MRTLRIILLLSALASLAACASPPYSKQGATREQAAADYQDCYSLGSLEHYTPGKNIAVDDATANCMKARGYSSAMRF
ncbi:hypothetical protein [Fundidesulfovibrio soli]|uniref:hypothetical protein n=1 Tax=Fundidesulfovibrio soli TaxID=2922716 RepID=UPI001FAFED3D|nr:hypothetical protein [Fundidesulfovibrio soli]